MNKIDFYRQPTENLPEIKQEKTETINKGKEDKRGLRNNE